MLKNCQKCLFFVNTDPTKRVGRCEQDQKKVLWEYSCRGFIDKEEFKKNVPNENQSKA